MSGTITPVRMSVRRTSGSPANTPSRSSSKTVIVGHAAAQDINIARMSGFQRRYILLQVRNCRRAGDGENVW